MTGRLTMQRQEVHLAIGVCAVLAVTAVLKGLAVTNTTTVSLALLVAVLWTATASALWVAVTTAFSATLALNVFFMPPIGTLTIADPENWLTLVVFLIVGVVASELSAAARARAAEAMAERKDAEAMRQQANLSSALLASLSHDLRTPLTAIRLAVENLQNVALPAAERQEQVRVALTEVQRLTRLFRDILDMARIDAAALTIEREWVGAPDVIEAAISSLRPTLDARILNIDADPSRVVSVDPRLTSAALSHLIENAAQYSPASQPVDIRGWVDATGLRLTVRDHGAGIDPSDGDQVFKPFYRGTAARTQRPGTGMGLAISRGLLAAEGGQVGVEPAPGGGAQFSIFVPSPSQTAISGDEG